MAWPLRTSRSTTPKCSASSSPNSSGATAGSPESRRIVCQSPRSGSMPAVPGLRRRTRLAMTSADWAITPGFSLRKTAAKPRRDNTHVVSDRRSPVLGACSTCTAMSGSGARRGRPSIRKRSLHSLTPHLPPHATPQMPWGAASGVPRSIAARPRVSDLPHRGSLSTSGCVSSSAFLPQPGSRTPAGQAPARSAARGRGQAARDGRPGPVASTRLARCMIGYALPP
jgi:hypothetical protein